MNGAVVSSAERRFPVTKRALLAGALLLPLCMLALLVVRAQPLSASPALAFAQASGCPPQAGSGCFLGIEPAATSVEDALARLTASAWVREVNAAYADIAVFWNWSGAQPGWIDTQHNVAMLQPVNGRVASMLIPTRYQLGDIAVAYALSPDASLRRAGSPPFRLRDYTANYLFEQDSTTWMVVTTQSCSAGVAAYWRSPVEIAIVPLSTRPQPHPIPTTWRGARRWCGLEDAS